MALPTYPMPIPVGARPQIKSLGEGTFSGAGRDFAQPLVLNVETCLPGATVQLDGADIPFEGVIDPATNRGTLIATISMAALTPGIHIATVTDANDSSDGVQIFVSV